MLDYTLFEDYCQVDNSFISVDYLFFIMYNNNVMDNQDQNTPIMSKIEIEEGSTEPKIVEVPIEEVPDTAFLNPEDVEVDNSIKIDEGELYAP